MNILLMLAHSIEEYDQLKLLSGMPDVRAVIFHTLMDTNRPPWEPEHGYWLIRAVASRCRANKSPALSRSVRDRDVRILRRRINAGR